MTNVNYLDPNPTGDVPVVLLHGLGANSTSWTLQFDALSHAGYRPIAPDIPGFGRSPYDGEGWSIKRVSTDLKVLCNELEITHAHVVGISMGGTIAQQLALDFPQLVRKLILVNTFAVLRPARLSGWIYFMQRFILVHTLGLKTQARFVAERIFSGDDQQPMRDILIEQISQADPRAYRAAMRALGTFNSSRRLGEIRNQTLIVTGEKDSTVPPPAQRVLVDNINGARQVIIPGAGHAVTIDQPTIFNSTLIRFLNE